MQDCWIFRQVCLIVPHHRIMPCVIYDMNVSLKVKSVSRIFVNYRVFFFSGIIGRGQRPQRDQARPMFTVNKVPGFAAQMRRENSRPVASSSSKCDDTSSNERIHENGLRSRDGSPKMPRPRSEEIPLEDMCIRKASLTSNGLNVCPERRDSQGACSNNSESSSVIRKHSEETSFTSPQGQESKPRRKGQVETV